jgi:hypothetical protein
MAQSRHGVRRRKEKEVSKTPAKIFPSGRPAIRSQLRIIHYATGTGKNQRYRTARGAQKIRSLTKPQRTLRKSQHGLHRKHAANRSRRSLAQRRKDAEKLELQSFFSAPLRLCARFSCRLRRINACCQENKMLNVSSTEESAAEVTMKTGGLEREVHQARTGVFRGQQLWHLNIAVGQSGPFEQEHWRCRLVGYSREMDHVPLFKELLRTFFTEFIDLFFPKKAAYLDAGSIEFVEKEFFTDLGSGSRHTADPTGQGALP